MLQIQVKNVFIGTHYYKDAPDEVAFLRSPHRHLFVVRTTLQVYDEDRELEFLLVQKAIHDYVTSELDHGTGYIELNERSCEWLARFIIEFIQLRYGVQRYVSVSVFEDDENGAIITKE